MPQEDYYNEDFNETALPFHPYRIVLYLLLIGITVLFLGTTFAYLYTRIETHTPPIQVPLVFVFNTMILMASSATLHWARKCYETDNTRQYQYALGATLGLTVLFMAMQYVGWQMLVAQGALLSSGPGSAYLYAISGLHFIHIIGGLPFMILFLITAILRMQEPVSVLVYFSDPAKRLKLDMLTTYWHYLDVLWIYLVVFFLVNSWL
jgi:cytochrome c oxidase subunit III